MSGGRGCGRLGWLLLVAGVAGAAVAVLQNATGLPLRATLRMEAGEIRPESAGDSPRHGWLYKLPSELSLPGRLTYLAMVFEDGQPLPRFGKSRNEVCMRGSGRFLVKERSVSFSTVDGSDPRVNGRDYEVAVPMRFKGKYLWRLLAVAAAGAVLLAATRSGRRSLRGGWKRAVGCLVAFDRFCRRRKFPWRIVFLALPSVLVVGSLPPLWKDDDALVQLLMPPSDLTVIHFGWFYSFLAHVPGHLLDFALSLFGMVSFPGWKFWLPPEAFTLRHAYALLLFQHGMLWLVLSALLRRVARPGLCGALAVLAVMAWSPFYMVAQLIGSEYPAMLFSLLLVVVSLELMRRFSWKWLCGLTLVMAGATASRHIYAMLAMVLPLAILLRAALPSRRGGDWGGRLLRGAALAGICSLAAVLAFTVNRGVKHAVAGSYGIEVRSTIGRVSGTRDWLYRLGDEDRRYWVERLSHGAQWKWTPRAIEVLAEHGQYWDQSHPILLEEISGAEGVSGDRAEVIADQAFNEVAMRMLKMLPPPLRREIAVDTRTAFFGYDAREFAIFPISRHQKVEAKLDAVHVGNIGWKYWGGFGGVPSTDYDHCLPDPYLLRAYTGLFTGLLPAHLLGVLLALAVVAAIRCRGWPRRSLLAVSLVVTATLVMLVNNVLVCFFDRYALPLFTLYPVAVLLLLVDTCRPPGGGSRVGAWKRPGHQNG